MQSNNEQIAKDFEIMLGGSGRYPMLLDLIFYAHQTAKFSGFWDDESGTRNPSAHNKGEKIALMHSELSEALEALRKGNPPDAKLPQFSSLETELADCVIRIFDFAGAYGLNLHGVIIEKMRFNMTRPSKHGKQF